MIKHINWQGHSIDVVSLGVGAPACLNTAAQQVLQQATHVIGAPHHFDEVVHLNLEAVQLSLPSPFSALHELLAQHNQTGHRIAVLASGDALFFGIGNWLIQQIGVKHLQFHPNISSVQAAFHAAGLPWQQATVVSLHGRPLFHLRAHLISGHTLAVLTDAVNHPAAIAVELAAQGLGKSVVWVAENLGDAKQTISKHIATTLAASKQTAKDFAPLNVCLLQLKGLAHTLPAFPGIADHLFATGAEPGFGMITKREVRLAILSLMQGAGGEQAWDIGAGCGSIAVEWARWNPQGHITAIESQPARLAFIQENIERFGAANCTPLLGEAPTACDKLPHPNAVFIGGSAGDLPTLLNYAWDKLLPGGKLVASAVTDKSQAQLAGYRDAQQAAEVECEWVELQVVKNLPDSDKLRELKTVQILKCLKH